MDWRVALPRVAPMLVGVALGWVGLAMLSPFFFVVMLLIGLFVLAAGVDRRRRRSEGDESPQWIAETSHTLIVHSRIMSAAAPLLAAVIFIYMGFSTGTILVGAGLLLLALGGFGFRRYLADLPVEGAVRDA